MSIARALPSLVLALTLSLPAAADVDFVVDPGSLSMRQTPKGTKIKFRVRKGSVAITQGETPMRNGASLQLFNSSGGSDDLCARLPAGNWRVSAMDPSFGPIGWTYGDPSNANGPVRRAHFNASRGGRFGDIRALLTGAPYTLDEQRQRSVGAIFRVGNGLQPPDDHTRYCTDFAPPYAAITLDLPGAFRAAFSSQFPGPCPVPPAVCSPGGAFLD